MTVDRLTELCKTELVEVINKYDIPFVCKEICLQQILEAVVQAKRQSIEMDIRNDEKPEE